jgi:hypothetical protein
MKSITYLQILDDHLEDPVISILNTVTIYNNNRKVLNCANQNNEINQITYLL